MYHSRNVILTVDQARNSGISLFFGDSEEITARRQRELNMVAPNCTFSFMPSCFGFLCLFIFDRQRDRARVGEGQREREGESQAGSALSAQSLTWGSNPQTMTP